MGKSNRKGQADIAPRIRGAFIRACEYNESKRGKDLTGLIADCLLNDTLNTLKVMASFNPSQSKIDITHKVEISDIIALAHARQREQLKDITPPVLEVEQQDDDSITVIVEAGLDSIEGQTPSEGPKVPDGEVPPCP